MSKSTSKSKQVTKISNSKTSNKKNIKKKETSRVGFAFFVLICFSVVLVATVFSDLQQVFSNKKETQELNDKYYELLEEEASLNSQVIKLQDPEYKARYARENQMYTKDGETILIIIDDNSKKSVKDEK